MRSSAPLLCSLLAWRVKKGKEDPARLHERRGEPGHSRPPGRLVWLHAASVGEAQSALILIHALKLRAPKAHFLVTTGTVTSAALMEKKLGEHAFHQFFPLDHPDWVDQFLNHWRPDLVLWMESELWPNMLQALGAKKIPVALVNARLSKRSFARWRLAGKTARKILSNFSLILAQSAQEGRYFEKLGASLVMVTDNLKYSAAPLPFDEQDLKKLAALTQGRPLWLYASSHEGEEALACRMHQILKSHFPDLLTILVPRHPERRAAIAEICAAYNLKAALRSEKLILPKAEDEIYIADTLGELGLFYRLAPVACIGRSFSRDGGGGHNPIEAAQLRCAVLHGPHVQYQAEIYREMDEAGASLTVGSEEKLIETLEILLSDPARCESLAAKGQDFARAKGGVLVSVLDALEPLLIAAGLPPAATNAGREQKRSPERQEKSI